MTNEDLCTMIKGGSKHAEEELLKQNMGFVKKTAYELYRDYAVKYGIDEMDADDMIQEGLLALLRAASGFSSDTGNSFMAYAGKAVVNAMHEWIRQNTKQTEIELDTMPEDSDEFSAEKYTDDEDLSRYHNTPERIVLKKEQKMLLKKAILSLPERNRTYLEYRFGISGDTWHSIKQAQKYFGLTSSKVRLLEKETMDLMRNKQ